MRILQKDSILRSNVEAETFPENRSTAIDTISDSSDEPFDEDFESELFGNNRFLSFEHCDDSFTHIAHKDICEPGDDFHSHEVFLVSLFKDDVFNHFLDIMLDNLRLLVN